jgi:hypothetical protein
MTQNLNKNRSTTSQAAKLHEFDELLTQYIKAEDKEIPAKIQNAIRNFMQKVQENIENKKRRKESSKKPENE